MGVENNGSNLFLGLGVVIDERHGLSRFQGRGGYGIFGQRLRRRRRADKILVELRALHERRDKLVKLAMHRAGQLFRFAQLM